MVTIRAESIILRLYDYVIKPYLYPDIHPKTIHVPYFLINYYVKNISKRFNVNPYGKQSKLRAKI